MALKKTHAEGTKNTTLKFVSPSLFPSETDKETLRSHLGQLELERRLARLVPLLRRLPALAGVDGLAARLLLRSRVRPDRGVHLLVEVLQVVRVDAGADKLGKLHLVLLRVLLLELLHELSDVASEDVLLEDLVVEFLFVCRLFVGVRKREQGGEREREEMVS